MNRNSARVEMDADRRRPVRRAAPSGESDPLRAERSGDRPRPKGLPALSGRDARRWPPNIHATPAALPFRARGADKGV